VSLRLIGLPETPAGAEGLAALRSLPRAFAAPSALDPFRDPSGVHLQWFAAEDEGRTEEPTEYKIRKAREEGRVAKSQELISALGLLLPALTLLALAPFLWATMREMLSFFLTQSTTIDPATDGAIIARAFFSYFLRLTWPVATVAVVAALASNLVQTGFLFTVKPITPDFSRIVPRFGQYFQKTIFSMEGLFNFAKSLIKVAVIGVIAYVNIDGEVKQLATLYAAPYLKSYFMILSLAIRIVIEAAIALLVLAVPDYMFQRRQYMESLKMSKQEVKEERKMYEGDPMVKSRLRERMRELLSRNMAVNVAKADVVVTNPTHFAVALEWNRETMNAPMVTAKGSDEVAARMRAIAKDNSVPIVENKPLARALYAETEVGDIIPEKYYQAIATILAHVYKMRGTGTQEGMGNAV
jgi:flagellar biosynthesis protein FlhB